MEPAEIQNEQFRELLENFINFLRKKCYKERPINKYRRILAGIDLYMQENGIDGYDPDVGRNYYDYMAASGTRHFRIVETRTAVRRLNDYCLGAEYKVRKSYHTTYTLPEDCEHAIRSYEQYCRNIGNKEKTVSDKRRMLRTFLTNCPACGNDGLNGLTVSSVTGACFKLKNKDAWAVVRPFLKSLFTRGIVAADYSTSIPHYKREFKLPASYTTEEIQKIEAAVDRNTATGKRDYAMLLFATRLGMRSGDIVLLRMDNIDFLHKTYHLYSKKPAWNFVCLCCRKLRRHCWTIFTMHARQQMKTGYFCGTMRHTFRQQRRCCGLKRKNTLKPQESIRKERNADSMYSGLHWLHPWLMTMSHTK